MYDVTSNSASVTWLQMLYKLREKGYFTGSHIVTKEGHDTTTTKELVHATMQILNPSDRIISHRPINPAFAYAEVLAIMMGWDSVEFLKFFNPRMTTWSEGDYFHGAYGRRLGCHFHNIDLRGMKFNDRNLISTVAIPYTDNQTLTAYKALEKNPDSRQVVLQIWNPGDLPQYEGKPISKDVPCNTQSMLLVRNGKLEWLQTMRSNDLMWGTPYNFIQWTMLQETMAGWLGLEMGKFTFLVNSLHVYAHHFVDIDIILEETEKHIYNPHDVRDTGLDFRVSYKDWLKYMKLLSNAVIMCMEYDSFANILDIVEGIGEQLPESYDRWLWLLVTEILRRKEFSEFLSVRTNMGKYFLESYDRWLTHLGYTKRQLDLSHMIV